MHFAYASPMNAFKNIWEDSRDTVTAIDSSSIGVLLLGISPHPMIFLLCEGRIIFEDFMKMDSPQFNGDPSVNAYRFLVGYHKRLYLLGLVGSNEVEFNTFQLFRLVK